jgi:hypothetical protein
LHQDVKLATSQSGRIGSLARRALEGSLFGRRSPRSRNAMGEDRREAHTPWQGIVELGKFLV